MLRILPRMEWKSIRYCEKKFAPHAYITQTCCSNLILHCIFGSLNLQESAGSEDILDGGRHHESLTAELHPSPRTRPIQIKQAPVVRHQRVTGKEQVNFVFPLTTSCWNSRISNNICASATWRRVSPEQRTCLSCILPRDRPCGHQ